MQEVFFLLCSPLSVWKSTWICKAKDEDCPFNSSSTHHFSCDIFVRTISSPRRSSARLINKLDSSSSLLLQFSWPSKQTFSAPVSVSSHLPWTQTGHNPLQEDYVTPLPCITSWRIPSPYWNTSSDTASGQNLIFVTLAACDHLYKHHIQVFFLY